MNFLKLCVAVGLLTCSAAMPMEDFSPLQCNSDINTDTCLNNAVGFSEIFSAEESAPLTIPCGQCVVMDYIDGSTITVSGGLNVIGKLHFPSTANVVLRTTAVFVQGTWSMETPDEGKSVKVTLYGSGEKILYPHASCCENVDIGNVYGYDCTCSMPEGIGRKPFVVAGGQLDIRAIDVNCPSWTTLKEISTEQSFKVDTAFANCLRPGDDILVTADSNAYDSHETFTVDSVDKATGEVVLQTAMPRVFPSEVGPGEPEFAAEVALLRRDVIFTADTDPDEDWIGGHSIVYHTPDVIQTIQGVQFENFGQEGVLGRYPIHFHKSGSTFSLVSKNVIINSNQRCVFIHDTDDVEIDDNVAFDTAGHCYATETGNERNNVFTNNLGAYTKKLTRSNGQSDSPGKTGGGTSTFWIRNMENTFVGNVAAGCVDSGFWLEMLDKYSNQLNDESFMDNSAHSSFRGLLTYRRGWKPSHAAVFENFKSYKNEEGAKFHITGNLSIRKSLFADNRFGVRYGAWNEGIAFEDCRFIGLSEDRSVRLGATCPLPGGAGIRASMNGNPETEKNFALKDVEFSNYICNVETITPYKDNRLEDDMGLPVHAENVSIVGSDDRNRPRLDECDRSAYDNWFMEDFDGTMGPKDKDQGFLVRDGVRVTGFLPEGSCTALPYDPEDCTAFCEGVCLRLVHLKPVTRENADIQSLQLTDSVTGLSQTYLLDQLGKAVVVLPGGHFVGHFLDSNDVSVVLETVKITAFQAPRCSNPITESDFSFSNTESPTSSPTTSPTTSPSTNPTLSPSTSPTAVPTTSPSASPTASPTATATANPTASPTEVPSDYARTYQLISEDYKCPSDGRLFKNDETASLEECHELCFNMPSCNFFTYRASRTSCMGCALENESSLASHGGYDAYEMTSIKAPSDFGYQLWQGENGEDGLNRKCPYSSGDRIEKSDTVTREECYHKCKENDECGWFSWGEDQGRSSIRGICFLCRSDANFESHTAIYTYELIG